MLSDCVLALMDDAFDLEFVRRALPLLRAEYAFWMDTVRDGHDATRRDVSAPHCTMRADRRGGEVTLAFARARAPALRRATTGMRCVCS